MFRYRDTKVSQPSSIYTEAEQEVLKPSDAGRRCLYKPCLLNTLPSVSPLFSFIKFYFLTSLHLVVH